MNQKTRGDVLLSFTLNIAKLSLKVYEIDFRIYTTGIQITTEFLLNIKSLINVRRFEIFL